MNISSFVVQNWLRERGTPADSQRALHPFKHDSGSVEPAPSLGGLSRLVCLARFAPLVACVGALTTTLPAAAQEAEPAPPPEQSPEDSAPPRAQSPEASPAPAEEPLEVGDEAMAEVVVTTYRSSLSAALERKRNSTGQVDAIVAEDMADFPDLNLAESLQRLPGISISRSNNVNGGEANQITVRGLGGLYTRVRVNGMEARGNVGNSSTQNGGRNFDFNLFASELFNSIVVHKTASADLEEGSLGAVVDLNTARAFNYDKGFTFVAGATAAYNDLADVVTPRLTGLVAYRDPGRIWGVTASAAYQRVRLATVSTDTVNWQKAPFRSVNGTVCADVPDDSACLEVADAFHPRIPRFGQDSVTGDRLGLTAGVQLFPTDSTEISLDALYANYPTQTTQQRIFPLIRANEGTADLFDYTLTPFPDRFGTGNDSVIAGTVNNAQIRSEHVRNDSVAKFRQLTLNFEHRFNYNFHVDVFGGISRSESGIPHDTTVNYDNRAYDGYRFDLTNDESPILAFNGRDVNDITQYVVPELRDRVANIEGGFDTVALNLHYDIVEQLKLSAGVSYKRATLKQRQWTRDGTVCDLGLYDCDVDDDGMNDVLGPPADPALTTSVEYQGDAGPGSTTRWPSPVIDGWVDYFDYYNAPLTTNLGGTNEVTENNLGYFLQAHGEVPLGEGEMRVLYDAGARYVETRQTSSGYQGDVYATVERPTYRDWLPSANAALWLTEELVVRAAAARVMARPGLGDLNPGAGVDSFAYTINFQNTNLDPTKATALDTAVEWYFGEGSILALALFYKDIDSFPIRESRRGTFASSGLPPAVILPTSPASMTPDFEGNCGDSAGCWDISQLQNGPGAALKGFEIAFQAPFSTFYGGLPLVLEDMGIVANYTYVDSTVDYQFFGNTVTERLIGLSNGSYNATLYYDDSRFTARASLAYRSDYLVGGPNSQGNLWTYQESETRLDAVTSYNVNEYLTLSLEGLNLTDQAFSQKVDVDAKRRLMYNKSGRTFLLGARFSY